MQMYEEKKIVRDHRFGDPSCGIYLIYKYGLDFF